MRQRLLVFALAVAAAAVLPAQERPAFRAGIDLLTLDASVVNDTGEPVPDLRADEFTVVVDGQPRRVVSVRFLESEAPARPAAPAAVIPAHTYNHAAGGRIAVIVVDRDSINPGSERALLGAATSVLDALGPGDAAGAVALPSGSVELTREHDRVKSALLRMTGSRPVQPSMWRDRQLSWEEALAYERQDARVIAEVVERECYNIPPSATGLINMCPPQLVDAARELLLVGRGHVQRTLAGLTALVQQLGTLRGTKQVILISGGIPFSFDLQHDYQRVTRAAADAGVVIHAIHTDTFENGPASRKVVSSPFGGGEHSAGLGNLSAATGGAFFMGVGTAAGVFDRLSAELRSFYQLGIETRPDDRPGALKRVELSVQRPGLRVRSIRTATVPGGASAAGGDRLATLLEQPTNVPDLPLAVASYIMRGDEAETLRVVIAVEVGDARVRAPAEWAFAVFNEGNPVATSRQRLDAEGAGVRTAAMSAKLLPGAYRLRVVAADGDGRAGVLDTPLTVGLRAAGALQFSDLMLGVADATGRVQARSRVTQGTTLSGIVEVMSADAAVLERTRVVIEITTPGTLLPIKRFLMGAHAGAAATILVNQVQMATADLPPGRYVASAIPHVDDQAVGRVSRLFEIAAP